MSEDAKKELNFDYGVIIGVYDGIDNLGNILQGVYHQSIVPKEVLIWVNKNKNKTFNKPLFEEKYKDIQVIECNQNYGVYARFSASHLLRTEYVMVFDDDTIPGMRWAENCHNTFKSVGEAILGARGIRLLRDYKHKSFGNQRDTRAITEVDFVGHSWVYPKHLIKYMFDEVPRNVMNGEDIHFSASAKLNQNIKTYVPSQPKKAMEYHGSIRRKLGLAKTRLSMTNCNHTIDRNSIAKYWMSKGWVPIMFERQS